MSRPASRVLVVIPVYGHHEMTHALIGDLDGEADGSDVVVVDNLGDYPVIADEWVVRPGTNRGWAGGTNVGSTTCRTEEHTDFLWLNNDTRLTPGFVAGLVRARRETGGGVIGPFYDCHWYHQRGTSLVPVEQYQPRREHYLAPFLDGTAMLVPAATVDTIGLLDADTFAPVGWGAEIDYCLKAHAARLKIVVTRPPISTTSAPLPPPPCLPGVSTNTSATLIPSPWKA
ncbi:MAG: glycosyltransferase family 2 protein [Actinomycetota bacterium]|nr:glycosyltransferase family 2 protein [Actinomycetota bacterium]